MVFVCRNVICRIFAFSCKEECSYRTAYKTGKAARAHTGASSSNRIGVVRHSAVFNNQNMNK